MLSTEAPIILASSAPLISTSALGLLPSSTFQCNKLLRAFSVSPINFHRCLSLFSSMCRHSLHSPNLHSFTFAISACATSSRPLHGRALHALLFKFGFELDAFISTSLLSMYSKTSQLPSARKLFDEIPHRDVAIWNSMITGYTRSGNLDSARELFELMPHRNVISWTSMISGYSQNERYEEAIEIFVRMSETREVAPNEVTITSILPACANVGAMELGEKIEAFSRKNNLFGNVFVGSALVEMYAKCGDVDRAMAVFHEVAAQRNVCSWNSMIMGLAVHGRWKESLQLFLDMKSFKRGMRLGMEEEREEHGLRKKRKIGVTGKLLRERKERDLGSTKSRKERGRDERREPGQRH